MGMCNKLLFLKDGWRHIDLNPVRQGITVSLQVNLEPWFVYPQYRIPDNHVTKNNPLYKSVQNVKEQIRLEPNMDGAK